MLAAALCAALILPASAQMEVVAPSLAESTIAGSVRTPALALPSIPLTAFSGLPALSPALAAPLALSAPAATTAPAAPAATAPAGAVAAEQIDESPALPFAAYPRQLEPAAPATEAAGGVAQSRRFWENFWSGAPSRSALAATVAVPATGGIKAAALHFSPALGAGVVLAGAYAADRGLRWAVSKAAARRNLDPHQLAAARLIARVVLWTAAALGALAAGGASHTVMAAALGTGGTILTLGLKDVLGNWIQGLTFLVSRPFTIGDRVQVGDQTGRVTGLDLSGLTLTRDDGAQVKVRHTTLATMSVVVFGPFNDPGLAALAAQTRLSGAAVAVWKNLGRGFWMSAAALGALIAGPVFLAPLQTGLFAAAAHWAMAGVLVLATKSLARSLSSAVEAIAVRNSWRLESRVLATLFVRALAWGVGGGAFLRVIGLSWGTLAASLGLTTIGLGLATNNVFGSIILGAEILFSKPFKVGDTVQLGSYSGVVADVTLAHVVIRLDENRRLYVPYAAIRDGVLIVTTGNKTP